MGCVLWQVRTLKSELELKVSPLMMQIDELKQEKDVEVGRRTG